MTAAASSPGTSGGQAGPVHWPSVLPEDAETAWDDLREWVEQLVDRYALEARTVPPCWFRHNGHVEALVALRDAERACFGPSAPASGGMDGSGRCGRSSIASSSGRPGPSARPMSTARIRAPAGASTTPSGRAS